MKKLTFLFAGLFLTFSLHLNAQDVPEVQRPLISKVAATWCPPCGEWAWDFFEDLITDNESQAVLLVAHHSGELFTEVGKAFSDNFAAPYQPYFYVGLDEQGVLSSNTAEKRSQIKNAVENMAGQSPVVNAGMDIIIEDGFVKVNTKTQFFKDAEGDYYLGVYVVENGVENFQAGQGEGAIHEKIMRASLTENPFGAALINGTVAMDASFTNEFSWQLPNSVDVDHMEVITIIWEKVDNIYQVVNTNLTTDFSIISSTQLIDEKTVDLQIFPNVVMNDAVIAVDIKNELKNAELNVVNSSGELILNLFQGDLGTGTTTFKLDRTSLHSAGLYFVLLNSDEGILTKRLLIQ